MPLLALTVVIWTIGEIAGSPVAQAYVADLAPLHLRGRYQGAWGLTFALALVFGPLVGTAATRQPDGALALLRRARGDLAALLVLGVTPRRRPRVA